MFLCRSAPGSTGRLGTNKREVIDYSPVNELGRPNPNVTNMPPSDPTYIGILGHNVWRPITSITDGTSNTILLGEDAGRNRLYVMGRETATSGPTGAWGNPATQITINGYNPSTNKQPGACAINCTNNNEVYSLHPGGANLLFGDGSVHFAPSWMNINILVALATRACGEVVSLDC